MLKNFFSLRIENLRVRLEELIGEKEDLDQLRESDKAIKEHLMKQVNELQTAQVEKQSELLQTKRRLRELEEE